MWGVILRKCNYAFKTPDRPTDEDELMDFMRIFIQKKVHSKLANKVSTNMPSIDNMSINLIDTSNDSAASVETEAEDVTPKERNETEKRNANSDVEKNCTKLPKTEEDEYRMALAKAFNSKFKTQDERWKAMLHLCTKLREFKLERERGGDNNNY